MGYSPELLDRVADAMDAAQEYWSRIAPNGREKYEVGYTPAATEADPSPAPVVLLACETREEAVDARDTMESRARASAALMAVGYVEPSL